MKASDIVQDCGTGKLSHTKLWANVGYLVMTVAFLRDAWTGGLDELKLIAFGVILTGSASLSKFLSMRFSQPQYTAAAPLPGQQTPGAIPGQRD